MSRPVPLNNIDHAGLRVIPARGAAYGDAAMFAPVFPYEFRNVQAHYPIVFIRERTGGYRPVALFGLEEGQNLFLNESGWDAPYLPMAVRMAPFLIGLADDGREKRFEVHIDLDHPRVSTTQGDPIFLEQGGHSPLLRDVSALLSDIHNGEQSVRPFCALLDELGLIEPFTLDIELDDGTKGRLAGYYTIAEEALYALSAEQLGRLQAAGALQPVYMAVASLSQMLSIIARRNRRAGGAA
ncbi:SapC family protein [Hyphomonas sp.]|uniref:SapC family protein n=1 Tax=Hyphomonas sp. TaxID=87 RepID=UPI0039198DF7